MIVSDSTTLIILFDYKKIELLKSLFDKVYIPKSVYEEINIKYQVALPDFFEICNIKALDELTLLLDKGESEAITLAIKKGMPLIIDEKKGRKIAKNYGLDIIGIVGILIANVKYGYLKKDEAIEFLNRIKQDGFSISDRLFDKFNPSLA